MLCCGVARILIAYASLEGQTARIASTIAEQLRARGHVVEVRDVTAGVDTGASDALIVGASVHYGSHPRWLRAALRGSRDALATRPGAFFSVSLSANPEYARKFLRQVCWQPQPV